MSKGLTPKQERFCQEYIKDCNATQAYIRAGYSPSTESANNVNASRLLSNAKIQARIQELQLRRQRRTEITADRIIQEWARLAFSDVTDVLDFDEHGIQLRRSKDLNQDVTAALETVGSTVSETEYGTKVTYKVKMHSKTVALQQLTKLMGLDLQGSIDAVVRAGYEVLDPRTGDPIGATATEDDASEDDSEDQDEE